MTALSQQKLDTNFLAKLEFTLKNAIAESWLEWTKRAPGTRVVAFSEAGEMTLRSVFNMHESSCADIQHYVAADHEKAPIFNGH